jgi:hypothetical protein
VDPWGVLKAFTSYVLAPICKGWDQCYFVIGY